MPWTLDRAARPVSPGPIAPPDPTDRPETAGERMRWRRPLTVAIMIAIVVLLGAAAYLASPAISDWLRHPGVGASAASPGPLASRAAKPAPSLVTPRTDPSASPDPSLGARPTVAPTPAGTPFIHVVARGEYLIGIAARYGVPVDAIINANRITDPSLIYVGERLIIPRP
jgi:nucleoid-associated protein YgaU